jgi:hypothetical protein
MLHRVASMRPICSLVVFCAIVSCNRGDVELRRADGSAFSTSGGEVALADGSRLDFVITSQRYKQWDAAQSALGRTVAARFGALLQPKAPTERSIARAVSYLEGDARAKQAIERAGMTVKDFVLMTVALEQEMRVASGEGAGHASPRTATPLPNPPAIDTGVVAYPVIPSPPSPQVDTVVRIDTQIPRRAPRDTTAPKDTVKRDTLPRPKPARDTVRDTVRDTTESIPPDTSPRP